MAMLSLLLPERLRQRLFGSTRAPRSPSPRKRASTGTSILDLPPELRLQIYEYHLDSFRGLDIIQKGRDYDSHAKSQQRSYHLLYNKCQQLRKNASKALKQLLAILHVCSIIRSECAPLVYKLLQHVFDKYEADSLKELVYVSTMISRYRLRSPDRMYLREDHLFEYTGANLATSCKLLEALHRIGLVDPGFICFKQPLTQFLTLQRRCDGAKVVIFHLTSTKNRKTDGGDLWMTGPLTTLQWEGVGGEKGKWQLITYNCMAPQTSDWEWD